MDIANNCDCDLIKSWTINDHRRLPSGDRDRRCKPACSSYQSLLRPSAGLPELSVGGTLVGLESSPSPTASSPSSSASTAASTAFGFVVRGPKDERERVGLVSRPAIEVAPGPGNSRGRGCAEGVVTSVRRVRGVAERRLVRPVRLAEDAGGRDEKGDRGESRLGPLSLSEMTLGAVMMGDPSGSGVVSRRLRRGKSGRRLVLILVPGLARGFTAGNVDVLLVECAVEVGAVRDTEIVGRVTPSA
jgi:hypothetical protein